MPQLGVFDLFEDSECAKRVVIGNEYDTVYVRVGISCKTGNVGLGVDSEGHPLNDIYVSYLANFDVDENNNRTQKTHFSIEDLSDDRVESDWRSDELNQLGFNAGDIIQLHHTEGPKIMHVVSVGQLGQPTIRNDYHDFKVWEWIDYENDITRRLCLVKDQFGRDYFLSNNSNELILSSASSIGDYEYNFNPSPMGENYESARITDVVANSLNLLTIDYFFQKDDNDKVYIGVDNFLLSDEKVTTIDDESPLTMH